ncbi:MAG: hypothetical protein IT269_08885 [Saprospiraceae bacterium]|nr:hypothetical protein [Saprospiraceae bacterium]
MRKFTLLFQLMLVSLFAFAQNPSGDGWVFKNEKDGIKVWYRKTSDIHEIKLATSLKTPLSGLVKLLSEPEHYQEWGYKVSEARLLKQVSDHETYYYSKFDFPWPLDDRDLIMHSVMEQDPITRKLTSHSVAQPDYISKNKGITRINTAQTTWTMVPGAGGWVYIEYYIYSSPGGSIPDWAVNMAIDVGPRETIKGIRKFIQQEKYQQAKLAYIKD